MIICEQCETRFKIKILNELPVKFCPCCGDPLHNDGECKIDDEDTPTKRMKITTMFQKLLIEKLS